MKNMASVGHYMFTKTVFYTPPLLEKKTQVNFQHQLCRCLLVLINVKMLVMTKKKSSNLTESVNFQNAGPTMNFLSVYTHALGRCFVTSEYVTD